MPPYATSGTGNVSLNTQLPAALWPGDEYYPFGVATYAPGQIQKPNDANVQYEAVVVGERSISCALAPRPSGGSPPGVMVQVFTNGNPGAAEIDVQDANIDADGAYLTPTSSTAYKITTWTQLGASSVYTGFTELQPEGGRFISLKVIANPNAVPMWAKLSYQ